MYTNRYIAIVGLGALVFLTACDRENEPKVAATPSSDRTDATHVGTEHDNTAKNKVDRSGDTKTPLDQSESSADIKITAEIRRAITNDDSLSVTAKNCKIITDKSGLVTLRGVVNSQAEKNSIDAKAKAVAGVTRVDNQLEVKTS
jgi:osmotically-inducible protein OsmY